MGLIWALAWFGVGLIILLVVGVDAADVPFPLGFGMFGFLAGTTFSGVLGLVEGRRRFDQMSLLRFAGWGAVGGLLLSGIFALLGALAGDTTLLKSFEVFGTVMALAGAGSASGVLAIARRAEDKELLEAGEEALGLTEEE